MKRRKLIRKSEIEMDIYINKINLAKNAIENYLLDNNGKTNGIITCPICKKKSLEFSVFDNKYIWGECINKCIIWIE